MDKVLIVEDSKNLAGYIKASLEHETGLTSDIASSHEEALKLIDNNDYFAAVTDLNLPDAETGVMVDVLIEKGLPTIVYTGDYSDDLRSKMWKKKIVDYVLKRDPESDKYISTLICQLRKNRNIDVLIADDSIIIRNSMKKLLEAHLFNVYSCSNATEALEIADTLTNLKLVISDYMMPDMDGFEFVRNLRKKFPKDKVAFIGISGTQMEQVSAKFIKFGANDFMMKPFSHEQFYTRVNQNLQTMLMIENILNLSYKDYLTGLYNRRFFFLEMEKVFDKDEEKTISIMDIDFFKKVNDTYGHDGGDAVLKYVADFLKDYVGDRGFVTRFGGEEFCIYIAAKVCEEFFDEIRKKIESSTIKFGDEDIKITASFGVTSKTGASVDAMITEADSLLYDAKTSGRNRVIAVY